MFHLPILGQRGPDDRHCNECGQCCEDIQLQYPPQRMDRINAGEERNSDSPQDQDHRKIADMLVYQGEWEVEIGRKSIPTYHYTCRHYSKIEGKGVCGIYETRPSMCSGFPWYNTWNYQTAGERFRSEIRAHWPYPSQYRGCTYNVNNCKPVEPELPDHRHSPGTCD